MKKYEEICNIRRESANKRWRNDANASKCIFSDAKDADIDIEKDKDKDIDKDIDIVIDTETEEESEADTDATAPSPATDVMKRFDEVASLSKYNSGEMLVLYDFVDEAALKRYLDKALSYNAKNTAHMVLRRAKDDGVLL